MKRTYAIALLVGVTMASSPRGAVADSKPHISQYGLYGSNVTDVTVHLHPEVWCPGDPPSLQFYCSVEVVIPADSDPCEVCDIMADAINNNPDCVSQGFSASCSFRELTVSNTGCPCPGAFVCFDPTALRQLTMKTSVESFKIPMKMIIDLDGAATGSSVDGGAPSVVVARQYECTRGGSAVARVETTPGMSPVIIAQELADQFAEQGDLDVSSTGTRLVFEPPRDLLGDEGYDLMVLNTDDGIGFAVAPVDSLCEVLGYPPGCESVPDSSPEPDGPVAVELSDLSPNPANATVSTRFKLNVDGEATVSLFDVRGRLVHLDRRAGLVAGNHTWELDLDGVASGVYFVRIQAAGSSATGRLIIRK